MVATADTLTRDHWYWRPGWRPGRRFYAWHVTKFVTEPPVSEILDSYAPALAALGVFDLVPPQWLHLTMQGIDFADAMPESEAIAIANAARPLLAGLDPIVATLGPIDMDAEAAFMPFRPIVELEAVRSATRSAIAEIRGLDRVPETAQFGWPPHVSLAYMNTSGELLAPLRRAVRRDARTWSVTISEVSLINLERHHQLYQWTTVEEPVAIGLGA